MEPGSNSLSSSLTGQRARLVSVTLKIACSFGCSLEVDYSLDFLFSVLLSPLGRFPSTSLRLQYKMRNKK